MRVLIVAGNASMRMGGEASLPFYYYKLLQERQIEVWMACHARVREELQQTLSPQDLQRIQFVEDSPFQIWLWKATRWTPDRIKGLIIAQLSNFITDSRLRRLAIRCIPENQVDLVFQPSPISPKMVSFMYGLGVPVVIGPLCGGLDFPPAFRNMDSWLTRISVQFARLLSPLMHRLIPGKLHAAALIVANQQAAAALPVHRGKVYEVVESGVDLALWQPRADLNRTQTMVRFVYAGRFVDWKGAQYLVEAFQQVAAREPQAQLELIGDGPVRQQVESRVNELKLQDKIIFHGWLRREESAKIVAECDVFMMPSLRECGGTAILEAMAQGLPVITTNWAGPASYVNAECGILVDPNSPQDFVNGLAQAMIRLAHSQELRQKMGAAGIQHVRTHYFDWGSKTDRIIEIFKEVLQASA